MMDIAKEKSDHCFLDCIVLRERVLRQADHGAIDIDDFKARRGSTQLVCQIVVVVVIPSGRHNNHLFRDRGREELVYPFAAALP
jgi:hypothetical protein